MSSPNLQRLATGLVLPYTRWRSRKNWRISSPEFLNETKGEQGPLDVLLASYLWIIILGEICFGGWFSENLRFCQIEWQCYHSWDYLTRSVIFSYHLGCWDFLTWIWDYFIFAKEIVWKWHKSVKIDKKVLSRNSKLPKMWWFGDVSCLKFRRWAKNKK